jgi:hypothetical protein
VTRRRAILTTILVGFAVCVLVVARFSYLYWLVPLNSDGPTHTFPLPGIMPITDQQAIAWSKEVLISDGRFTSYFELLSSDPNPELAKDARDVSRGDDPAFVIVCWFDKKTYWFW